MGRWLFGGLLLIVACFVVPGVLAKETEACPELTLSAIQITADVCADLGRNEACYGNSQVTVEAQNTTELNFDSPGDRIGIAAIKKLALSPMNVPHDWGVALLKVQANLPGTLPGQNVTMVLFGNVYIENQVQTTTQLQMQAINIVNLRTGPGTNFSQAGQLAAGERVRVDGRTEAGDWLRVRLSETETAWVFAPLVTVDGEIPALTVISGNSDIPLDFNPMQAFYFQSGIGDVPCREAPESGILIQTPEGQGKIKFLINGAEIQLGSTAFIQSQFGGEMTISLLEGAGSVRSDDVSIAMLPGARATIPLDENGFAAGPPELNEYNTATIDVLPLTLLENEIVLADALTDEEIAAARSCSAYAREAHINGRVGPGDNRGALLELPLEKQLRVIGQAPDAEGDTWYRLAPNSVRQGIQHENIWVARAEVKTAGGCRGVAAAEIPPLILAVTEGAANVIPLSGTWVMVTGAASSTGRCPYVPAGTPIELSPCFRSLIQSFNRTWTVDSPEDGLSLTLTTDFPYGSMTLLRVSPTRYVGDMPSIPYRLILTPISDSVMQGTISNFSINIAVELHRQG